jgi:hypothetical protein
MLLKPDQSATQLGSYRPISMTPSIARLQIDGHFCEETHCCGGHGLASKSKETLYALEIKKILTQLEKSYSFTKFVPFQMRIVEFFRKLSKSKITIFRLFNGI